MFLIKLCFNSRRDKVHDFMVHMQVQPMLLTWHHWTLVMLGFIASPIPGGESCPHVDEDPCLDSNAHEHLLNPS